MISSLLKVLSGLAIASVLSITGIQAAPIPAAGLKVRELVALDGPAVRATSDGTGKSLDVLMLDGDVWHIDIATGHKERILQGTTYVAGGQVLGFTLDKTGVFYLVVNRADFQANPHLNKIEIFHGKDKWFETVYPYGIDTFTHGVSKIEVGPDNLLYVSSGSRTDHGEPGHDPALSTVGEVPMTSCIWRLDPAAAHPTAEIFASGLRNCFGFCFDEKGRLWGTENGPNEDAPEEINRIDYGKHYGFPYKFSTIDKPLYADEPAPPQGLSIELPVLNIGPAGGGSAQSPLSTLDPHSSPSGIVWIPTTQTNWPAEYRGTFVVGRFGNLLGKKDVGFDLLSVKIQDESKPQILAQIKSMVAQTGRITDLHFTGGKLYVVVYDRHTTNTGAPSVGSGGACILEVSP